MYINQKRSTTMTRLRKDTKRWTMNNGQRFNCRLKEKETMKSLFMISLDIDKVSSDQKGRFYFNFVMLINI